MVFGKFPNFPLHHLSPPLKKINIFCIFPYKFFASCNCWFGMHLPQGLLERYPLGFYIISILASPKKTQKPFFFRKQLSPLIYVTSRAPILFKLGVLVVTFTRSIVRREYLPPPLPNFFFQKKKHSPPKLSHFKCSDSVQTYDDTSLWHLGFRHNYSSTLGLLLQLVVVLAHFYLGIFFPKKMFSLCCRPWNLEFSLFSFVVRYAPGLWT